MNKLLIIATGPVKQKYLAQTKPRFEKYANMHGFDFVSYEQTPENFDRSLHWIKITKILEHLDSCDNILYMDCDISIVDFTKVPTTDKDIGICRDNSHYINTGMMIIKSSDFSKQFFKSIWNDNNPTKHCWEDNYSFIQKYDALTDEDREAHFEFLNPGFNVTLVRGEYTLLDYLIVDTHQDLYFRHFAGRQPWNAKYF